MTMADAKREAAFASGRLSQNSSSLVRITGALFPVNLGVQILGFAAAVALANVLGATHATDAYFLGLSVPVLTYGILLAAIRLGAIPALTEIDAVEEEGAFSRAASELVAAVAVASAALAFLVTAAAYGALPAVADGSLLHLARRSLLELAPLGPLGAVAGAIGAVLAVRRSFVPAVAVMAFDPLLRAVLVGASGRLLGVQSLIVSNLLGAALACVVLWMLVRRRGVRLVPTLPAPSAFITSTFVLSLPLLVSQSVLQLNPIVDRVMAAGLGAGKVTALELGLRIVPTGLFAAMLIAPVAATWSSRRVDGGFAALRSSVERALLVVAAVVPPVALVGIVLRNDVVKMLFGGGAYSHEALHDTAIVFAVLLIGLPAQVLAVVYSTLFVVEKDTKLPMKIGIANVVLNVVLNVAFRPLFGIGGIALSTSLTYSMLVAVYAFAAHRRWGAMVEVADRRRFIADGATTVLCGAAAWFVASRLEGGSREAAATAVVAASCAAALPWTLHQLLRRHRSATGAAAHAQLPARAEL